MFRNETGKGLECLSTEGRTLILQKTGLEFLGPTLDGAKLSLIPAPGVHCPLVAFPDNCTHLHVQHTHVI